MPEYKSTGCTGRMLYSHLSRVSVRGKGGITYWVCKSVIALDLYNWIVNAD